MPFDPVLSRELRSLQDELSAQQTARRNPTPDGTTGGSSPAPKPPHDLLDRQTLLKIGATDPADQVHTDHPRTPFPAAKGQKEGH